MKTPKRKPTMFDGTHYTCEIALIAFICMIAVASANHSQSVNMLEQINVTK